MIKAMKWVQLCRLRRAFYTARKTTPFAQVTSFVRELITGTTTRVNNGIILKQV